MHRDPTCQRWKPPGDRWNSLKIRPNDTQIRPNFVQSAGYKCRGPPLLLLQPSTFHLLQLQVPTPLTSPSSQNTHISTTQSPNSHHQSTQLPLALNQNPLRHPNGAQTSWQRTRGRRRQEAKIGARHRLSRPQFSATIRPRLPFPRCRTSPKVRTFN